MKHITFEVELSLKGYSEPEFGPCGYENLESVTAARNVIRNLRALPPATHIYRIVKVTREVVR